MPFPVVDPPPSRRDRLARSLGDGALGLLPVLVLALSAFWTGTFQHAGLPAASLMGLVALALLAGGASRPLDPLFLGGVGRALLGLSLLWLLIGQGLSEVPRAGRDVLLLVPLLLLASAATAQSWRGRRAAAWGVRGLVAVQGVVASWALLGHLVADHPRPALPLGHHNLLALWLVGTLPFAVTLTASGRGRADRALGGSAVVVGLTALAASRSLAGLIGLAVELLVILFLLGRPDRWRRWRRRALLALGVLLALAALEAERLGQLVAGRDPSARARSHYYRAAIEGIVDRPAIGHGPGSVPWTIGEYFEPVPGIHPAGEVLSDLHSLPLQLAYELGLPGTLLVLVTAALWWRRRWREPKAGTRGRWSVAAQIGLAGMAAALVVAGIFGATAIPLLAAVLAGIAASPAPPAAALGRWGRGAVAVAVALLVLAQLPALLALVEHRRARLAPELRTVALERAAALDSLPLYRAQKAWASSESAAGSDRATAGERYAELIAAATAAPGLAPFWLGAGAAGLEAGRDVGAELERACALDPLDAFAPFLRLVATPTDPRAPAWGARALLLEPRLGAATFWQRHPALLQGALREAVDRSEVPAGWREELKRQLGGLPAPSGLEVDLGLVVDRQPATSLSLFVFRRQPLPLPVLRVPLDTGQAAAIDLVSAAALPEAGDAFRDRSCGGADPGPEPGTAERPGYGEFGEGAPEDRLSRVRGPG